MKGILLKKFSSASDRNEFNTINTKDNIRNATRILYFIITFEIIMLVRLFITKAQPYPVYVIQYMVCYIFLLTLSVGNLICVYLSRRSKKDTTDFMYAVTSIYAVGFVLWAVAVSILDSHESEQFIVFLTVVVCITSLLKLRPWLFLSIDVGGAVLLTIGLLLYRENFNLSQTINLAVFTSIFAVITIIKYNNTVEDFYNKKKINELNDMLEKEMDLLEIAARTDRLTGLLSRNVLKEDITKRVASCFAANKPIGVVMFDLDDFKAVNDRFGHVVGDECLKQYGLILKKYKELTVYRYGGEEFLAVCDGISEDALTSIIENIRRDVTQIDLSSHEAALTVSAGYVFTVPSDADCDEKLIKAADKALYIAKTSGKNRIVKATQG